MQHQTRTPGRNTPGRRRNANKENVYFEPGKYGRKTGLTLKDTGVRDEHGFEPVSGIFSSPRDETPQRQPLARKTRSNEPLAGEQDITMVAADDALGQDDSLPQLGDESAADVTMHAQSSHAHGDEPNTKRKRGARRSDISQKSVEDQPQSETRTSTKRRRISAEQSVVEPSPGQRLRPSTRQSDVSLPAPLDEPQPEAFVDDAPLELGLDEEEEMGMQQEQEEEDEGEEEGAPARRRSTSAPARGRKRGGRKSVMPASKRQQAKNKQAQAAKRPPGQAQRARHNGQAAGGDSDEGDSDPGTIMGGIRLRSATPFEDPDVKVTRSGRASIKPLAYWKNETFVYEAGERLGVVRAEELPATKRKRSQPPQRRKYRRNNLARIDEEGEGEDEDEVPEDLLAEAWEEEVGVISGPVRAWDAEIEAGSVDEEVVEDVGFAARAIETREVAGGSTVRFAKVLSTGYFGAGVLEIPPRGVKQVKNCRKMQMAFFVHEGKVTVDVAGMVFGVTPGGMWQVPRGNNYSIENESDTYPAKIFFSQGCEFDARLAEMAEAESSAAHVLGYGKRGGWTFPDLRGLKSVV
ncbi:hypothetical protein ANO11243_016550 [Dothideomycetidae sp. 11243]|nr:hypothetical protein ANO11243_016550 [fungal sp. No.11243]